MRIFVNCHCEGLGCLTNGNKNTNARARSKYLESITRHSMKVTVANLMHVQKEIDIDRGHFIKL